MDNIMNIMNSMLRKTIEDFSRNISSVCVNYKNIHHIMLRDVEVQNKSETEKYTFVLKEGWRIVSYTNDYITIIKEV